ncbi:hypothetical protein SAMN05660199_01840 [Klenkia soli]|uniref:DUF3592 domain-containing protein n=1 Tax=Klenkia soli TaxID=1052260 RepID=A0A1H0J1L5_9ACTN|nr:hypothetical protein [Klenkia soli]SDO37637.1 hypothetical protein SAMN05660199_01840 [Klenkia soli]
MTEPPTRPPTRPSTGPSTGPPPSRPHTRARTQLLLGLVPVLVVGVALLVVLALRLGTTQEPLARATGTATATVESVQDREVEVAFTDADGRDRQGRLELREAVDVPTGAEIAVQYAPSDDGLVYADGDAAHAAVQDVLFGLVVVALVVAAVVVLTVTRVTTRPRLARRPATTATATHLVVRQGLLVRSWLELGTARGVRWLPVHWAPELDRMRADTAITVHGDPAVAARVLPVVDGQQLWPSGRSRRSAPRGDVRQAPVDPAATEVGMARQLRGDAVALALAPVVGLLWAYVDGSGPAGFAVATALAAVVLLWVPQLLGSSPAAARDQG